MKMKFSVDKEKYKAKCVEMYQKTKTFLKTAFANLFLRANAFSQKVDRKLALAENAHLEEWQVGQTSSRRFIHWILWAAVVFILIGFIWAHFAILDEVTVGEGKVIPSSQIQVIQNLEGGIVKALYVKDGSIVQKDQVLVRLDPTRFGASYQENEEKAFSLQLKIARLTAEADNKPFVIVPSAEIAAQKPDMVRQEQALYESHQGQLKQLEASLALMQKQLDMTAPLVKDGAASEIELLRLQQNLSDIQGKIALFKTDTLSQLTQAKADLAALRESNVAYKDRLERTIIRSPVKGIVKQVKVTTIGGVIQPGMDLMEIVPLDDTLSIEAKIRPSDIGFLRVGMPATVKITAFDYSIYGGLTGKVEQISADSIIDDKDQKQQSYYLIRVRTQKNYLGSHDKPLYIIPGMMATVDVLTGHKSVLHYLLKPIIKARENALRER